MDTIKEALTFDDVTLAPKYSEILPSEVNTETKLSKNLSLKIPLLSLISVILSNISIGGNGNFAFSFPKSLPFPQSINS